MSSTLVWHGIRVKAVIAGAADRALGDAAEFILETANRTIPHETGNMERTGRTHRIKATERAISYDTPYAVRQHEDLRNRHAEGRRARWLALTLDEERARVVKYVNDAIRRVT